MTDMDSASSVLGDPSQLGTVAVPRAASPEATGSGGPGGGITFNFVFKEKTYTVNIYSPDQYGQYGFTITQGTTTIASLIYKDDNDWAIAAGLPSAFQVDSNFTINALTLNISAGTVTTPP